MHLDNFLDISSPLLSKNGSNYSTYLINNSGSENGTSSDEGEDLSEKDLIDKNFSSDNPNSDNIDYVSEDDQIPDFEESSDEDEHLNLSTSNMSILNMSRPVASTLKNVYINGTSNKNENYQNTPEAVTLMTSSFPKANFVDDIQKTTDLSTQNVSKQNMSTINTYENLNNKNMSSSIQGLSKPTMNYTEEIPHSLIMPETVNMFTSNLSTVGLSAPFMSTPRNDYYSNSIPPLSIIDMPAIRRPNVNLLPPKRISENMPDLSTPNQMKDKDKNSNLTIRRKISKESNNIGSKSKKIKLNENELELQRMEESYKENDLEPAESELLKNVMDKGNTF